MNPATKVSTMSTFIPTTSRNSYFKQDRQVRHSRQSRRDVYSRHTFVSVGLPIIRGVIFYV